MCNVIVLTKCSGEPIFVNAANIMWFRKEHKCGEMQEEYTVIEFQTASIFVRESPGEILKQIRCSNISI